MSFAAGITPAFRIRFDPGRVRLIEDGFNHAACSAFTDTNLGDMRKNSNIVSYLTLSAGSQANLI